VSDDCEISGLQKSDISIKDYQSYLKSDPRDDPATISELRKTNGRPVTYDEGREAAKKIGAAAYYPYTRGPIAPFRLPIA
jgi:hypothetical protein